MNRYSQLSGHGLQLPMMQLPYEKLDELLGQQKALIDTTNQLASHAPKYIQESQFATDAAKQINQYQQGVKEKLSSIAATGNTKDYMEALDQAQQQIAKLYRPGGLAYNLEQDYATYQAHVAAEQKKLSEGKIMPEVYQQSVMSPLQDYDNAKGTKRYNPTLRPESINADKFANDFVKNYQDSKYNKGDLQIINGRVFYKNTEVSGVDSQRILNGLSAAYKNAASTTGQLEDMFNVRNKNGDIVKQYKTTSMGEAQQTLDLINSTDLKNKEQVKKLQTQLNKFGLDTGGLDGDAGPKTQAAIDVAKRNATDIITNLPNMQDADLFPKIKDKFMDSYVNQMMAPYADAASRRKEEVKFTDMGETPQRFAWEEDYKSKKRKEEDRLKEGVLRFEGTSSVFNPNILPSSSKDLEAAKVNTQSTIDALQAEFDSTDDPQRRQNISSQIMWNKAILDKQNQLRVKAETAVGASTFDREYNLDKATEQEKQILRTWQLSPVDSRKDSENIALGILKKYNPTKNSLDLYTVLQKYSTTKNDQDEKVDEWLKNNKGQNNFELNTIGVSPEESTAIKQSLNTNNWTFFDENGPVDNVETSTLLGTKEKPIVSQNVTIGGITKAPFGELGNLVTLTDAKGKVYYAASKGGNVGKVIGNNMKNKAPEGSEQWILGHMLSDPSSAGILGQMTDMQDEDSRIIVSGTNSLGKVDKKQVASGTLFTLHAPDGVIFPNGKTTMEYNNMENLTNDLQIINNSLNGTTSN